MTAPVLHTVAEVRAAVAAARARGQSVALVPTMGALHAGHGHLVTVAKRLAPNRVDSFLPLSVGPPPTRLANSVRFADLPHEGGGGASSLVPQERNDQSVPTSPLVGEVAERSVSDAGGWRGLRNESAASGSGISPFVVVSVFVNPTQFGPTEDFAKYPRTLDADRELVAAAGGDLVFGPSAEEMYPPGTADGAGAFVEVPRLDAVLCGPRRPGHFRGVCTVVLKLLNIVGPDVAVFGQKDAQQAIILTKMVADLNVPVRMHIEPTVREADGLAMSSRNRYLSADERKLAPKIHEALRMVQARAAAGELDVARLESALLAALQAIPGARVDYANILGATDLSPMSRLDRPALAAVAVFLGTTRLIDNVILSE